MNYIKTAIIFSCGIYLSNRISIAFSVIFIISLIMVLTVKAIFKHCFNIKILISVLIFTAGTAVCSYASDSTAHDLYIYTDRYVTISGRISEIPAEKDGNTQYVVDVRSVKYNDGEESIKDKLLLTAQSGYEFGDNIEFCGFVEGLPKKMNENGFDYARYYKSRKIFFKMYSSEVNISERKYYDFSLHNLGMSMRNTVSNVIDSHYNGDYAAVMKAVLTGNKKDFSKDFLKVLTRTGVIRIFYPAFLHVMLFLSLMSFLLGMFEKKSRDILTIILLIIYAMFMSGIVLVKICILISVLTFMRYRHGYVYYLDALGAAAVIIGLINPLIFFNGAFVMSMTASILMYYFRDYVRVKLKFISSEMVRRTLTTGIICTIGLMPFAAYFFNGITVCQIFYTAVMLPCIALILVLSPLLILMLALFNTAPIVGQAVSAMLFVLRRFPYLLDKIGIYEIPLPKPSLLLLIIYVLVIVAAVKRIKNKRRDMKIALFAALALSVLFLTQQAARFDNTEISFVNVGQGDGVLIKAPYRYNVLIDGGGGNAYSDYDVGEKVFLEYLLSEGITYIDSAFVTHYHKDHAQGIVAAIENIRVKNLFLPDNMEGSEWRTKLEQAAHENNTRIYYISEDTRITYNNGMTINIITPALKTSVSDDENDTSYVYRMEYRGFSALFTGDMTKFAEKCLIEEGRVHQADLLKVAHHGSGTSTDAQWLEAVNPRYAVISVGEDNTYSHPHKEVLERLADTELYRTDIDGDIHFCINEKGIASVRTLNGK